MSSQQQASASTTALPPPPSLNVYKKVAVIRRSDDNLIIYDDAADETGNKQKKSVSVQELGHAISSATPLQTPRIKLDIPVPRINIVDGYRRDVPDNFIIPNSYIVRHQTSNNKEWNESTNNNIEYIADLEDEQWLYSTVFGGGVTVEKNNDNNNKKDGDGDGDGDSPESINTRGTIRSNNNKLPRLSLKMFEHMMDLLEKATGFESIITTHQADALFKSKVPHFYRIFPPKAHGAGVITSKQVLASIYDYWVEKRSKLKRPLLRRYWPVTSTDDTNPHMVFRPREKEKYKLRKKRQNDANAYRKMKQLRDDFDNLRCVLDLVRKREEIYQTQIKLQIQLFKQRLYDAVDTTGRPRHITTSRRSLPPKPVVDQTLDVPTYFDVQFGGRRKANKKRARSTNNEGHHGYHQSLTGGSNVSFFNDVNKRDRASSVAASASAVAAATGSTAAEAVVANVAGRNHGEPAPNFLQPLSTRESYTTSWEQATPHIATYVNAQPEPTYRFRQRPRVGRGGRLCIDRVPMPPPKSGITPHTVFTAGLALPRSKEPKQRLLDLLPKPLDHAAVGRRIEGLSIAAIKEDHDAKSMTGVDAEENDGDEVIVKLEDWLETDDQMWGDERYAVGPI